LPLYEAPLMKEEIRTSPPCDLPLLLSSRWWAVFAARLNPRRLRIQAIILGCCLWGVCAVDFSSPGLLDRAGNIKFQDFIQFYISARLIDEGRAGDLYDQNIASAELHRIVQQPTRAVLPTVYGPQVSLLFVPLASLPFLAAASIWTATNVALFFFCLHRIWKCCPNLRHYSGLVVLSAICFPPFFHFFLRGQISVLVLACFTAAFLAFRSGNHWLAGVALGLLAFKPQFLVAIPLVLLISYAWKALAALVIAASAQLTFTWMYFGTAVMRAYVDTLLHIPRWIAIAEPGAAQAQMHSLRSFWILLIPWPTAALVLYVVSSIVVVTIAVASWRSRGDLALRFSALVFAAVLINPHLFVYDLLVLAPALLLLTDWALGHSRYRASAPVSVLVYLAFLLPLFGPVATWTHLQLSVPVFVGMQALIWPILRGEMSCTPAEVIPDAD
jgi:hypothetical protein